MILDVFFLEGLDEGLFLSFQISVNLHENTSIILKPSCSIKTVKTCHGCSMLGLQFYPLALPKNVDNGEVLGLCSRSLSSGLYLLNLLGQPRRITGTTAMMGGFCHFCPLVSHASLSRCWSMPGSTVDSVDLFNREKDRNVGKEVL